MFKGLFTPSLYSGFAVIKEPDYDGTTSNEPVFVGYTYAIPLAVGAPVPY